MKNYGYLDAGGYLVFEAQYPPDFAVPPVEGLTAVPLELSPGLSPGPGLRFHYDTQSWSDCRSLDEIKANKWTEIKKIRSEKEFSSFWFNQMEFDGDVNAQRRLNGYISISKSAIAVGLPFEAEFTLKNNQVVTLTAQNFVDIEMAKIQQVAAVFAHAIELRQRIDDAKTVAQIEGISWGS